MAQVPSYCTCVLNFRVYKFLQLLWHTASPQKLIHLKWFSYWLSCFTHCNIHCVTKFSAITGHDIKINADLIDALSLLTDDFHESIVCYQYLHIVAMVLPHHKRCRNISWHMAYCIPKHIFHAYSKLPRMIQQLTMGSHGPLIHP